MIYRYFFFFAVFYDNGSFGREPHQTPEGVSRAPFGTGFEHFAHRYESEYHSRRFKIKLVHIFHNRLSIAPRLSSGHGKEHRDAVAESG